MPALNRAAAVGLALLIAVMPGLTAGRLAAGEDFSPAGLARYALAGALVVGFGYAIAWRRRPRGWAAVARLNRRLLPLLASPCVVLILDADLAAKRGGLVFGAAAVLAVLTGISAASTAPRRAPRSRWDLYGVGFAALAVAVYLAHLAVVRHQTLQTNTFDLGVFANAIWNTGRGDLFRCTFLDSGTITSEHFSPVLLLFGLLDRGGLPLSGLVVVQALVIVSGAIPAYLLGRRHLGAAGGRVLALAWLLHPAVHANTLWDFHPLSLAPPLIVWMAWVGPVRRPLLFWSLVAALLSLREELAVFAVPFGLFLVMRGGRRRGLALAAVAILYIGILVSAGLLGEAHVHRYSVLAEHGGGGRSGLFAALFLDPAFVVQHAFTYAKVGYVLMQAMPVMLVVLWSRQGRVLLAVGLAMVLLASSGAVVNPYFHYSSLIYAAVFAGAGRGATAATVRLARLSGLPRARVRRGVVAAMFVGAVATTAAYGGLHDNPTFRAGFTAPRREASEVAQERLDFLREQMAAIPDDQSVAVTGRIGPHFARRTAVYQYPKVADADVLVVFWSDLHPKHKRQLQAETKSGALELVRSRGSISVYRRNR